MNKLISISIAAVMLYGCKDRLPQEPEQPPVSAGSGEIVYNTASEVGLDHFYKVMVSKVDGSGSTFVADGLLMGPPAAGRIAYTRNDSVFVATRSGGVWSERLIMGARDSSQRVLSLATALSPDGRLITYTVEQLLRSGSSWTEGPTYAYLAQADGSAGSGTILPKYPAHETTPIFSPDSRWLAMYTGEMAWANGDGELWVMGTTSGDVRRVADGIKPGFDGGAWLDWSPDAQKLIYNSNTSDRGLYMVNRDGTGRQRFEDGAYPIWSPDGKKIAYIGGATIDIFIKNADGTGTSRNISNEPGVLEIYPQWSPDGKQMVYTVYAGDNEKVPAAIKVADVEDPSHVRTILPADPSTGSSSVIKGFWLR